MECNDANCPEHGTLATRGLVLEGTVVSAKMQKTAIVQREGYVKVKKYQRYKRATSRIPAHNPPCINAKEGDRVRIMECRKLGKTVSFVITEKIVSEKPAEKKAQTKHELIEHSMEREQENPKEKKTTKRKPKVKNG